jgi:hypothetical protein
MEYLKQKFSDHNNNIKTFLTSDNCLLSLEKNDKILETTKKDFVEGFVNDLLEKKIINERFKKSVDEANAWSIDFPSWHGEFNEKKGKKIFIIGSEPHIHHKYLQTVYGFNNERGLVEYINNDHPIFKFISDLLSYKFNFSKEEVLKECYLTDLFPLSPFRGNGISVGSTDKLQELLQDSASWIDIRYRYAKENLPYEVENVKPEIIVTQGKEVFEEVIKILGIKEIVSKIPVPTREGRNQFIRSIKWNGIDIISVPHIGSKRMRTFWNNNMDKVKEAIMQL